MGSQLHAMERQKTNEILKFGALPSIKMDRSVRSSITSIASIASVASYQSVTSVGSIQSTTSVLSTPSVMSAASHLSRDFDFDDLDGLNVERVLDDLDKTEKLMMKEALDKSDQDSNRKMNGSATKKKVQFKAKGPNPDRKIQHQQNAADEIVTTVHSMWLGIRRKLS